MAKPVNDRITPSLARIAKDLEKLPQQVYDFWIRTTPKRTGNARKSTDLKNGVIHANYPYAQKLDEGYSKQAPRGMVEPTDKFVANRLKQILRK